MLAEEARLAEDQPTTAARPPVAPYLPAQPRQQRRVGPVGWVLIAVGVVVVLCLAALLLGAGRFGATETRPVPVPAPTAPR